MAETSKMDRNLALEAVRVSEAAALSASRLMGRGDEKAADQAAVDAMRESSGCFATTSRSLRPPTTYPVPTVCIQNGFCPSVATVTRHNPPANTCSTRERIFDFALLARRIVSRIARPFGFLRWMWLTKPFLCRNVSLAADR